MANLAGLMNVTKALRRGRYEFHDEVVSTGFNRATIHGRDGEQVIDTPTRDVVKQARVVDPRTGNVVLEGQAANDAINLLNRLNTASAKKQNVINGNKDASQQPQFATPARPIPNGTNQANTQAAADTQQAARVADSAGGGDGPGPNSGRTIARAALDNSAVKWALNKMGVSEAGQNYSSRLDGGWKDQLAGARDFFWSGTGGDKAKKIAAGAGVYMGANLVGRGITGGGVTYNDQGERDIMGIPFF